MHRDDDPDRPPSDRRASISVALLVGVALMPIVIAVGFMMDGSDSTALPGDISVAAMRGGLDGMVDHRSPATTRAGF